MLLVVAWLVVGIASAWTVSGVIAVAVATRRRVQLGVAAPAVSVLKPLRGSEPELERNLQSFFEQDHADFEIVFGVVDARDPALAIVERVRARYPNVACRTIVHAGAGALNPKVDNLLGLLPHAKNDLVLVSDSNVRAPTHYVRELATLYAHERPGLVTNLFAGGAETSLAGALESVELSGFCAAGVALPTLLGDPLLVGKSALFSRENFERLGGLSRLADVLAEDFVMGKTFAHAGQPLLLAPSVLVNTTSHIDLRAVFARHLRWSMLRFRLRPVAAALEPLTSPLALLPVAWILFGPFALLWAYGLIVVRDAGGWLLLRGTKRVHLPLLLGPLRDCLALVVWLIAPLKHHVSWRGQRFRIGAGTLLYRADRARG